MNDRPRAVQRREPSLDGIHRRGALFQEYLLALPPLNDDVLRPLEHYEVAGGDLVLGGVLAREVDVRGPPA